MVAIKQIEFHITHVCNLQCDGCAHYCNYGVKGSVPFSEGEDWLRGWSKRVNPERFKILGGEPSLHAELLNYVNLVAELWPATRRTLTTNGYFLDRHPKLPAVLHETGTRLYITIHSNEPSYLKKIVPIARLWSRMSREKDFICEIGSAQYVWYKSYKGFKDTMIPFTDNNPRASWEVCISKYCSQLHKNRLWKCPCLAYLDTIADRCKLKDRGEWAPFLAYNGIGLEASDEELKTFISMEEEAFCRMCPSRLVKIEKSIHEPLSTIC